MINTIVDHDVNHVLTLPDGPATTSLVSDFDIATGMPQRRGRWTITWRLATHIGVRRFVTRILVTTDTSSFKL